jgi:oligopeptide transport system substrate-binding protein
MKKTFVLAAILSLLASASLADELTDYCAAKLNELDAASIQMQGAFGFAATPLPPEAVVLAAYPTLLGMTHDQRLGQIRTAMDNIRGKYLVFFRVFYDRSKDPSLKASLAIPTDFLKHCYLQRSESSFSRCSASSVALGVNVGPSMKEFRTVLVFPSHSDDGLDLAAADSVDFCMDGLGGFPASFRFFQPFDLSFADAPQELKSLFVEAGIWDLGNMARTTPRPGPSVEDADFILSNGSEPTLDPSLMNDLASTNVGLGLFEGLMQYDPRTNLGVPALAESWSVSPDGLRVTFKLRTAFWSDGHPVTAGDFVYAMQRILDPETAADYAYLPALVIAGASEYNSGQLTDFTKVGIKALDERTLEYRLVHPAPYFVDMTAANAFWPLPRWAIERWGTSWTRPEHIVTNGPYLLKEWKPQAYIFLVKNSGYWDAANVALEGIKILSGDDDNGNFQAYKDGAIDWLRNPPLASLDEAMQRTDFHRYPQIATYYYEFNLGRPPVDDPKVRLALALAIDKQGIVEKAIKGGQLPTDAMVPPVPGYRARTGLAFDPDKARRLLAEAGYPGGKGFPSITVIYNTNAGHKLIAEYVKRQWKDNLGIDVVLENMDFRTLIDRRSKQHDFTIARSGWVGDYLDAGTMLDLFITGGGSNDGRYSNPEFDRLIAAADRAAGPERLSLLRQAEDLLLEDVAIIPLYFYANMDLIDADRWEGWYPNMLGFHPWKYLKPRSTPPKP